MSETPTAEQLRALIAKWRDAATLPMSSWQSAHTFDQCADELEAALAADGGRALQPALADLPDDYQWALDRVQRMCGAAYADARVYRTKLLKGFGYPNEVFSRAQDARALEIILRTIGARQAGSC